jgi:RHS repeat-associated protein
VFLKDPSRRARARWLTRYDGLDRLTHADNTSNVTQRAYPVDKTGNRTGKQTAANGAITPYTYAATNHRLASNGTEARTYDAVGNPLTIGARTLTYDDRSRLAVFVNGTTTRRYQYTGQGLRVRKWTSSNTSGNTYFVYNENAQLIGEYDNAGARVQEIVWLGNLPIGVIAGTAATPVLHYIESDHLGTPRVIVDATRNVGIWRWNQTNDPFGESTPNQNPDGDTTSFTFNLRFAGQYRDSESGWYYNVHRYYDPATGRYLESDPIGLGGGISTYGYVGAAPLTAVDPLGLHVVGVYDVSTGVLSLSDTATGGLQYGLFFSGGRPIGQPIPNGHYDVLEQGGRSGFFRLEPVDRPYGDDTHNATNRNVLRLHRLGPLGMSEGCITAEDNKNWAEVEAFIRGTPYVDEVRVRSKSRNPLAPDFETLIRYGRIEVINSPN